MSTSRTHITAMVVAVLAAACGGGDDGDVVPPPSSPYVLITAANQDTVARTSVATMMPFVSVPVILPSPGPVLAKAAQARTSVALGGSAGITQLALQALEFGAPQSAKAPLGMARPLAVSQQTMPCAVSGTLTVTTDDKDNSKSLSPGDTISIAFNQCDNGDGQVNGGLAMTIATYSRTATVEDVTGAMTFQSLAVTAVADSFSMNGGAAFRITYTIKSDGEELFGSFTVGSGGVTVTRQSATAGLSDTYSYRAGYAVSDRDFMSMAQGVPSSEIITASGDFGSKTLGGDLTLTTNTPFKSVFTDPTGDIFPIEGQLLVSGRDGTKLRLTATTTIQVRMEVSDDSDADWEYTKLVDWPWLFQ